MFHMQFRTFGQNLCQLFKGMCEEVGLAVIVTGKRMCSLDDPVHVVRDVIEETFTISGFQMSENFINVSGAQLLSSTGLNAHGNLLSKRTICCGDPIQSDGYQTGGSSGVATRQGRPIAHEIQKVTAIFAASALPRRRLSSRRSRPAQLVLSTINVLTSWTPIRLSQKSKNAFW